VKKLDDAGFYCVLFEFWLLFGDLFDYCWDW